MGKASKIDVETLIIQLDTLVKRVKQEVSQSLQLDDINITADQWILLRLVMEHGGLTQKDLAALAGKDNPTVTRMLELMIEKDWVVKEPTPGDRRSYLILPTKHGQETYRIARDGVAKAYKRVWKSAGKKETKGALNLCKQLLVNQEA
jgi:DNA-binding MarR family transcriptional regulator